MSEEDDLVRNILLVVLLVPVALAVAWFLWIVYGIAREGQRSQIHRAFSIASERAIQLDRYGRVFAQEENSLKRHDGRRFFDDPSLLSCDARIATLPADNPAKSISYAIIESMKPLRVYIIYTGRPPDFSPVFNSSDGRQYFAPQVTQYNGEAAKRYNIHDFQSDYDNYIAGRRFQWESHECKDFSYTIVWESWWGWLSR